MEDTTKIITYSELWDIRGIANTSDLIDLNRLSIERSEYFPGSSIDFCTLRNQPWLCMSGSISSEKETPETIYFTFSLLTKQNDIYKSYTCRAEKNPIYTSFQYVKCHMDILDLVKNQDQLLTESDKVLRVLCEVKIIKNPTSNSKLFGLLQEKMNHSITLQRNVEYFFKEKKFTDIILVTSDGTEHQAHKFILAARSPVFASMFEHDMQEKQNNRVEISDIDAKVMSAALEFIYTGNFENCKDLADEIVRLADKYDITFLKDNCVEHLSKTLNLDDIIPYLILADEHSCGHLKYVAIEFIIQKLADIVHKNNFKNLKRSHPHLLEDILCSMVPRKILEITE